MLFGQDSWRRQFIFGIVVGDRQVIAVDGLAASGKSTLAQALAKRLNFTFLSSGLIYRAVGFLCHKQKIDPDQERAVVELIEQHRLEFVKVGEGCAVQVDTTVLGEEIHRAEVSDYTSRISVHPAVRALLLPLQRQAFEPDNLVVEGRDIGTIVFPRAAIKFFISAPEEVRIARRLMQGARVSDQTQTELEIKKRDKRDSERSAAPAKPADDALLIENIEQGIGSCLEHMEQISRLRLGVK